MIDVAPSMENTLLFALRVGDYQGIGAYAYTNANGLQALVKLQQETFDGMTSQWGSDLGGSDFVDIGSWVHYRLDLDLTTHQVTFKYANKIQVDDQPFNSTIGPAVTAVFLGAPYLNSGNARTIHHDNVTLDAP